MDLVFSITHHSVFITHHSKYVSPMHATLVWLRFHFLFPSLISHIFELWVSEFRNKKLLFWVIKTELRWHDGKFPHTMDPTVSLLSHHTNNIILSSNHYFTFFSHFIHPFLYPLHISSSPKLHEVIPYLPCLPISV